MRWYLVLVIHFFILGFAIAQPDSSSVEHDHEELISPPEENLILSAPAIIPEYLHEIMDLSGPYLSGVELRYSGFDPSNIPEMSYVVPQLSYSDGGSRGIVSQAQLGCGIPYVSNPYRLKTTKIISVNGKKGIVGITDTLIQPIWEEIRKIYPDYSTAFIVKNENKWGIIGSDSKVILEIEYDSVESVSHEKYKCVHHLESFKFYKNGLVGIYNLKLGWIVKPKWEALEPSYNSWNCPVNYSFYKVKKQHKVGVVIDKDSVLFQPQFDTILSIIDTRATAPVSYTDFGGFIYTKGKKGDSLFVYKDHKLIHASVFDDVIEFGAGHEYQFYKYKLNGKIGVVKNDVVLFTAVFDKVHKYGSGFQVTKEGLMGFVDDKGQQVISCSYHKVISERNRDFLVVKDDKIYFIDENEKLLFDESFDKAYYSEYDFTLVSKDEKFGLIDLSKRKKVIPLLYDDPYQLPLHDLIKDEFIHFSLNGKFGLFDTAGNEILPFIYDEPVIVNRNDFPEGTKNNYIVCYSVVKQGVNYIIFKNDGEITSSKVFGRVTKFDYKLEHLIVSNKKKLGIKDFEGDVLIPLEYKALVIDPNSTNKDVMILGIREGSIDVFYNYKFQKKLDVIYQYRMRSINSVYVRKGIEFGVIDSKGNWLKPLALHIYKSFNNGMKIVQNEKRKKVFIDSMGLRSKFQYDNFQMLADGNLLLNSSRSYGVFDTNGVEVVPLEYDKIKVYDSIYALKKNGYYALSDKTGKLLSSFNFQKVKYQYENAVCVRVGSLFGVVTLNGEEILPPISRSKIDLEAVSKRSKTAIQTRSGTKYIDKNFHLIED